MPIQRGLVIQYVSKGKVYTKNFKKYTTAAQHTGKATRTTQPEEVRETESDE